jgi:hypothetical protein
MGLPKKIKANINLTPSKVGYERRVEMLDMINENGTYLPKSLLHEDLDRGFLDFVKNDLELSVEGRTIPCVDILMTTQNWANFTQTWSFQNTDKNPEPPFITTVRIPEVKYGSLPSLMYTIPNRRQYFYAAVPTWNGDRKGVDIYTIPQPVPIDIQFQVKIVCNRMRELNKFNKIVIEKFSSRQSYAVIKGHYIPIILNDVVDESVMDLEKRKYYVQSYTFTMMGFLMDEDEFEVKPAVSRVLQLIELDKSKKRSKKIKNISDSGTESLFNYPIGNNTYSYQFKYDTDLSIVNTLNVDSFQIYINNLFYGSNTYTIQINNGDTLRIDITKDDNSKISKIEMSSKII